jgi:hypothetical protein
MDRKARQPHMAAQRKPFFPEKTPCRSPAVSTLVLVVFAFMPFIVSGFPAAPASKAPVLDDATPIVVPLKASRRHYDHHLRTLFDQQILPRLDVRHVSEFVIGRNEIRSFIARHLAYFETLYHRMQSEGSTIGFDPFIEQFIAPANVEIGTFFFKERFGQNEPFPIVLFDAAFDGEGITTLGDLRAALQSYEMPRLARMRQGIDYGSFQLDRARFLKQHLYAVKLVLECDAINRILVDDRYGRVHLSTHFKGELQANYGRYYRMLERLAEGTFYMIDPAGNPSYIETPLDLELGRAQLRRMYFTPSPDHQTGRVELMPTAGISP